MEMTVVTRELAFCYCEEYQRQAASALLGGVLGLWCALWWRHMWSHNAHSTLGGRGQKQGHSPLQRLPQCPDLFPLGSSS